MPDKDREKLIESIRESYDRVSDEYARHISHELKGKPLDRKLLERFAKEVGAATEICDLGCGPGHVASFLYDVGGTNIFGMDLSPKMLEEARRLHPRIRFQLGDMFSLPLTRDRLGGIVSFYSICNIPKNYLLTAFGEMNRVLRLGGKLLLSFHVGNKELEEKELWGRPISMNFYLFETEMVRKLLNETGFEIEDTVERDPYPSNVEYQSRRAYIFARKARA